MSTNRNEMAGRIVDTIAARYARRCWWADKDELVQEGWLVVLELKDMTGETDDRFRAYVWKAVMKRLSRSLWRESSPVTASKPGRKTLEGVTRAGLRKRKEDGTEDGNERAELVGSRHPETCAIIKESLWVVPELRKKLRTRLVRLTSRIPKSKRLHDVVVLDAALRVLVDRERPSTVARRNRLDILEVYRGTEQLKHCAMSDPYAAKLVRRLQVRRAELAEFRSAS